MSVQHLYQIYSGKIALSTAIQELLRRDGFSAAFAELSGDVLKDRKKYF